MRVLGKNCGKNANSEITTTLHVSEPFPPYYNNIEAGRSCVGEKVESIYVGTIDCSDITVGANIDIRYEKAVQTAKGLYQPIKGIDILD